MRNMMTECRACGSEIAKSAKSCPYCGQYRPPIVRNPVAGSISIAIALFIFVFILEFAFSSPSKKHEKPDDVSIQTSSAQNIDTGEEPSEEITPIQISAVDLFAAYAENEVNADNQYKNKVISVTGVITNIGKDMLTNAPCVSLDSGSQYNLQPIQCFFPKSDERSSVIAALKDGQTITITGECTGLFMTNVQVSDCNIAE